MWQKINHAFKRLWFKVRAEWVYPDQVREGDRFVFDFPGTGPYVTSPVTGTWKTWTSYPWIQDGNRLYLWLMLGNGGSIITDIHQGRNIQRMR